MSRHILLVSRFVIGPNKNIRSKKTTDKITEKMVHTTSLQVDPKQVSWFRLLRSGLVEPFDTPEDAASQLVGVQAQILPAAALALWNRTRGFTYARCEELLYTRRTLVKLWGQRNTLHIYASADWPLIHGARTVNQTWWERQAENPNNDFADYRHLVEQVAELMRGQESMGRGDLRATGLNLHEDLFSPWGGIFADLVRGGYACHARRVGNEGHFAHRERWLPDLVWNPPNPTEANRSVARRYFAAYGPALPQDFGYWRGIKKSLAYEWLAHLEDELAAVTVGGRQMLALRDDLDTLAAPSPKGDAWPVRMLYRFDPLVLAHKDKAWITSSAHYNSIWRPAGHIEGIVLSVARPERPGAMTAKTAASLYGSPRSRHCLNTYRKLLQPLRPESRRSLICR